MLQNDFEVKSISESEDFIPLAEGLYQAVIEDVNAEEQRKYNNPRETEVVFNFKFLILDGEEKGKRVWRKVRPMISEGFEGGNPSILFSLLKAVLGRSPKTDTPFKGQDLNKLIGRQLQVLIKHKESKKGKIYSNIVEFLSAKKNLEVPALETKAPGEVKKLEDRDFVDEEKTDGEVDYDEAPVITEKDLPF